MPLKVCIDPGHGGEDSGAVGFGTEEDDVALLVAFKLREALQRHGIDVRMTRTGETYPTLQERCDIANTYGANAFVSCHFDCSDNAGARGNSVLYAGPAGERLATKVNAYIPALTPWPDRGLSYRPGLAVLNGTRMAAIIVEGAFISNSEEHALIVNPGWQRAEAEAIAHGVCDFLGVTYHAPTAPAPKPTPTPVVYSGRCVAVAAHVRIEKAPAVLKAIGALGVSAKASKAEVPVLDATTGPAKVQAAAEAAAAALK